MRVPFFDLADQHHILDEELSAASQRVLASGQFILGAEVEAFENEIATYLQAPYAIGVSSGTDALLLALMTLDIGTGDEVLCPSFSFFATAGCIARLGAKPVFVDVCLDSFNIDVEDAANKVTSATRAIIPVHLFGQAADMGKVLALADKYGLAVIEDAAQAMGAHYHNQQVGTLSDFGAFSFFPTKNLGGFGDGGLLTVKDDALAAKARALRVHGASKRYQHDYLGANFRLDALQAALLRVKLKYIERYIQKRQTHAGYYNQYLKPIIQKFDESSSLSKGKTSITLPTTLDGNRHTWNQYTIYCATGEIRDRLKDYLKQHEIDSMIYYPSTLDCQPCFASFVENHPNNLTAHRLAETCLSLPVYPELTDEQRSAVVLVIEAFLSNASNR